MKGWHAYQTVLHNVLCKDDDSQIIMEKWIKLFQEFGVRWDVVHRFITTIINLLVLVHKVPKQSYFLILFVFCNHVIFLKNRGRRTSGGGAKFWYLFPVDPHEDSSHVVQLDINCILPFVFQNSYHILYYHSQLYILHHYGWKFIILVHSMDHKLVFNTPAFNCLLGMVLWISLFLGNLCAFSIICTTLACVIRSRIRAWNIILCWVLSCYDYVSFCVSLLITMMLSCIWNIP